MHGFAGILVSTDIGYYQLLNIAAER